MSERKESYSSEFKAEVALKALSRNKKNLEPLSEQYEIPVSLILTWAVQLERNAGQVYQTTSEPTDIEVDREPVNLKISSREIEESIEQGVMSDDLNYKRLVSWTVMGLALVIIFVQMLIEMFQVDISKNPEQVVGEDAFYQVTHKNVKPKKNFLVLV